MPAFRLIYKLFMLNLKVIFYRNICTTTVFFVVLVLPTLMSAKPVKISDRGVFYGVYVLASVIYASQS